MRISDWMSDVCSSDLEPVVTRQLQVQERVGRRERPLALPLRPSLGGEELEVSDQLLVARGDRGYLGDAAVVVDQQHVVVAPTLDRSDERRVGKGCVITCSSRGQPYIKKKKKNH